jgi:hypothetical protein
MWSIVAATSQKYAPPMFRNSRRPFMLEPAAVYAPIPPLLVGDYVFTGDEQWLVASRDGVIVVIDDLESRVDYLPVFFEPWSTCCKKAALEAGKVPLEQPAYLLELPVQGRLSANTPDCARPFPQ